jgi:hypothetical protein
MEFMPSLSLPPDAEDTNVGMGGSGDERRVQCALQHFSSWERSGLFAAGSFSSFPPEGATGNTIEFRAPIESCRKRMRLLLALVVTSLTATTAAEQRFAPTAMAGWPVRVFEERTDYELVTLEARTALRAQADAAASARYYAVEIDLDETPWIVWSWRMERLPRGDASERVKAGDDYALRLYVVQEGWLGRLSARALNYVWSRSEPVGARWPNAFTGRAHMVVVDSGSARRGQWVEHRRNLRQDWQTVFGDDLKSLQGVAIMTDADNTGSFAAGYYAAVNFCADPDCTRAEEAP